MLNTVIHRNNLNGLRFHVAGYMALYRNNTNGPWSFARKGGLKNWRSDTKFKILYYDDIISGVAAGLSFKNF